MTEPKYQAIKRDRMGKWLSEDEGTELTIYAGEVFGTRGPASTFSPMNIYKADLKKGATTDFQEPAGFNTGFLVLSGELILNEEIRVKASDFVLFESEDRPFRITGAEAYSEVFVLSGEPIREPIAAMGPFVMNTEEEIRQVNWDYQRGLFGSSMF